MEADAIEALLERSPLRDAPVLPAATPAEGAAFDSAGKSSEPSAKLKCSDAACAAMGVSAGAAGVGMGAVIIGALLMLAGTGMFMSGPLFTASHEQSTNGPLGLGGSSNSASATLNLVPVLGLVVVLIGAVVLVIGLKGAMHSFERGKERDEGTRHHLTVKKE